MEGAENDDEFLMEGLLTIWILVFQFAIAAQDRLVNSCANNYGEDKIQIRASLKPGWKCIVQSPGFPKKYPANKTVIWTITAPDDYELLLALKHFELEPSKECKSDYLQVSSINPPPIPTWRRYCSILSDNYIQSLPLKRKKHRVFSEQMTLKFVSDGSSEFKGFQGEIRLVAPILLPPNRKEEHCVNHLNDTKGSFFSPKYPASYPTNMSCTWDISVPHGKKVHLRFKAFDLENARNKKTEDCLNDYVEIREGVWGRRGGLILGRFCGEGPASSSVVISPTNKMWVRFFSNSDPYNKHTGFKAEFKDSVFPSPGSSVVPSYPFSILLVIITVYITRR